MSFIEGFGFGLGMVLLLGPVFFTLLKNTLQYGIKAGVLVALGIFTSDLTYVILCSLGAIPFFENTDNQFWLALLGSIILLGLGVRYFFKPADISDGDAVAFSSKHYTGFFAKGFLVNFVNPFVFLVWVSIIGYGHKNFGVSAQLMSFLGGVLLAILTTDILKVIFAHRIKAFIKPAFLRVVYKIIGLILIIFGLRLVWFLFS